MSPRACSYAGARCRRPDVAPVDSKISVRHLSLFYGEKQALRNISIDMAANQVTALIGPSGCGKSTFLRTLNRMNDIIPKVRIMGEVKLDGQNIYEPNVDVVALRRRIGMVFQRSNPFPKSIFDNVAYGIRVNRLAASRGDLAHRVEQSLRRAAL